MSTKTDVLFSGTESCEREVRTGAGFSTVKLMAALGSPLETVTLSIPALDTALAGTVATIWLFVIELGIKGRLPKKTCVVRVKFVPVSVSAKSLEPAVTRVGLMAPSEDTCVPLPQPLSSGKQMAATSRA